VTRSGLVRLAAVVVLVASGPIVATPATARSAALELQCPEITAGTEYADELGSERESLPLAEMEVDQATTRLGRLGKAPGQGVVVAVLDSGVAPASGIPVVGRVEAGNKKPPEYYHGTAVAGLIAGPARADGRPVGIAPAAQILDVQVYDDPQAEEGSPDSSRITTDNVVAGLDAVIGQMGVLNIKVVTIALALPHDQRIAQRVNRLWRLGVVVVAPTGNRPGEDEPSLLPTELANHRAGEDVADLVHPADYRHVLAVNASMTGMGEGTDPTDYVLENSRTMLAAPTAEAVSYSVQGGTCVLGTPATSWAAAEVSGVLALLQSHYDERPAKAVARLLNTANGRTDVPNTLVGAGEVQALEALTRPLVMDEQGNVLSQGTVINEPQVLSVPEDPPDAMASTRQDAVWWGLLGGGILLLALVLRPMLARRRTPR
jgi:membrane-anchored mycosin MYCP